jgi:hypothetical protein
MVIISFSSSSPLNVVEEEEDVLGGGDSTSEDKAVVTNPLKKTHTENPESLLLRPQWKLCLSVCLSSCLSHHREDGRYVRVSCLQAEGVVKFRGGFFDFRARRKSAEHKVVFLLLVSSGELPVIKLPILSNPTGTGLLLVGGVRMNLCRRGGCGACA